MRRKFTILATAIVSLISSTHGWAQPFWDTGVSSTASQPVRDVAAKDSVAYAIRVNGSGQDTIQKWDRRNGWANLVANTYAQGSLVALEIEGDHLYVLGNFTTIGGISAAGIAKLSISTGTWSALGSGVPYQDGSKTATSVAVTTSGTVFVGYSVNPTGSGTASGLLREWNGSYWTTHYNEFSFGHLNGQGDPRAGILCLKADGNDLYIGGHFNTVTYSAFNMSFTTTSWNIVKRTISNTYSSCLIDTGVSPPKAGAYWNNDPDNGSGRVYGIAVVGNSVFVTGHFSLPRVGIARFSKTSRVYNAAQAQDLSIGGTYTGKGFDIRSSGSEAYFVGNFNQVGSLSANGIAKVSVDGSDIATWAALGGGLLDATMAAAEVQHVAVGTSAVYASGSQFYAQSSSNTSIRFSRWLTNPGADPCMSPQITGWTRTGNTLKINVNPAPAAPYGPPINYYWWINGSQVPSLNGQFQIQVDPATVSTVAVYVYGYGSGVSVGSYNEDTNASSFQNNYYNCP